MENSKILKSRQQKKSEALNAIRQIYHTKYQFPYRDYPYEESSFSEQREYRIRSIIEQLERDLTELKQSKPS